MEVTVLNNQSLFDIALQVYGSAEAAFLLSFENTLSISDDLASGQVLQFAVANVANRQVVDFYRINNIKPATALDSEQTAKHKIFDYTFDFTFE